MEISFWVVLAGLAILGLLTASAFLLGWFLGSGVWDERTAGYQGQMQDLRSRLLAAETSLAEERAISAEAQRADLERVRTGQATTESEVLRGELAALRSQISLERGHTVESAKADAEEREIESEALVESQEKKTAVLERIRKNATRIDFDRVGRASAESGDDLKKIKGIGPFIEEKLHAAGIHTFRQIANLTAEDEDILNEIIEFFPGRVRREKWAKQAREFLG